MARIILVLALVISSLKVLAQNQYFNQQLLPLGDESALIANSGIAGQSPNSAILFNPAALVLNQGNSFSFSGNAYYEFNYTAKDIFQLGNRNIDLEASGLQVMPTSLIYHLDRWDWNFSFALGSPAYMEYSGFQNFESPGNNGGIERLSLSESLSESMYTGFLGAGKDLGKGWSIGFSLYGNYYSVSTAITSEYYNTANPSFFFTSQSFTEAVSYSLGMSLGLLKQWEKLTIGFTAFSPNIAVYGKGKTAVSIAEANPLPFISEDLQEDLKTHLSNGYRLGTGLNYRILPQLEYSLDFNYFGAQSKSLFPNDPIGPASYRLSSGLKWRYTKDWAYYLGFGYLPGSENQVQRQTFIFTGGSRFKLKGTQNSIGLFFAESTENLGRGDASFEFFGILIGSSINLDFNL